MGMGLCLCGYELILSMSGFPSRIFDDRIFIYRPLELYATGREFEKSVVMIWEGSADKGTVKLEIEEGGLKEYQGAIQLTANPLRSLSAAELGRQKTLE